VPGGHGRGRGLGEAARVARDEGLVEVAGGGGTVGDSALGQFGDQAALEAAVEPFAAAAGLGAVGEEQLDAEGLHGLLEVRGLGLWALFDV